MAEIRETLRFTSNDLEEMNRVMGRLQDRLDNLEGMRGEPAFYADVDLRNKNLQNVGNIIQQQTTTDTAIIASGTITTATITTATIDNSTFSNPINLPVLDDIYNVVNNGEFTIAKNGAFVALVVKYEDNIYYTNLFLAP